MAEKPDEQYEMQDLPRSAVDDDYEFDNYDETTFTDYPNFDVNTRIIFDYDTGENFYWNEGSKVYLTGKVKNLSRRLTKRLSDTLSKIFKFKVLKKHNPKLFKNSRIRSGQYGLEVLEYKVGKEWKVVYKRLKDTEDWQLEQDFLVNNPMEVEVNKAKEKYEESATKQVDDTADVDISEEVSDDIMISVYRTISDMLDSMEINRDQENIELGPVGPQQVPEPQVDISELQAKLTTLESVNRTLEKNLRTRDFELNKLRAENANEDVINSKQQEINNLQAKLRSTELERTQLLLDVEVTDEQLSEATDRVRELTEKNRDINEKFNQFKEAANKERQIERQEVVNRYWEQVRFDKEQARQEYTDSMARIKTEYSEKIRLAEADKIKTSNELVKAKERIKWLERAEIKQHSKPQKTEDVDLSEREIGSVLAGVLDRIERINDTIENTSPDDADWEKLVDGNLEALRVQAQDYKQKADNSDGYKKQAYKTLQRFTEGEIDKINLKLDRKVEYQDAQGLLKDETNNDYRVKFERLKEWLKKNGIEVTTLVVTVGSLVTVLATALRNTVRTIARGTYSFGKAVVKVLSKLGPLFSAIGSILMSALGLVSKGLMWLGNNLWFLLVLFVMFLWRFAGKVYDRYRSK